MITVLSVNDLIKKNNNNYYNSNSNTDYVKENYPNAGEYLFSDPDEIVRPRVKLNKKVSFSPIQINNNLNENIDNITTNYTYLKNFSKKDLKNINTLFRGDKKLRYLLPNS